MATFYNNLGYLTQSNSDVFSKLHRPGEDTPYSGIYRCEHCGKEATSIAGRPLPPQNHHTHDPDIGSILWRLIVWG